MTVSSALEKLARLQEIDLILQEKFERLDALRGALADWKNRLAARKQETELLVAQSADMDRRRRELEGKLAEEEEKMIDRRMRLSRIRNEREMRALQHEIELAKAANQQMENEVIQLMEELENLQMVVQSAQEQQDQLEQQCNAELAQGEEELKALTQEIEQTQAEREIVASGIGKELLSRYEQIRTRRGGLAVVEVQDAICLGCNMNLPPQFYNELLRGDDIRLCPNCHRILIWRSRQAGTA